MRIVWICMVSCLLSSTAWSQDAQQLHENGVRYLQQNDYGNAIIVLKKAAELEPANTEIVNDLGFAYFLAGQYKAGYDLMKPMAESKNADDRTYQITCMLLRGGRNIKEAELVYRIGLQTFPKSGALYADYGEFLELVQPGANAGIVYWEKGIQFDPAYPGNYYHAARYYAEQNDHFWAVIYGEIFVNMESYSTRTVETKNIMYDSYKRLFAFGLEASKTASPFQIEASKMLLKQEPLASNGINPEILTAMRTRFLLDWYNSPLAAKFPFKIFEHQRQLLQEGVFDAYNQWLFGSVANLNAFQNWTKTHPDEYVSFNQFQRNKLFKMTEGQYYH